MLPDYIPVFLQVVAAIFFAAASLLTSVLLGKRGRHTKAKDAPYECGKDAVGPAQPRFSVKFYLVAMLFILFDIEVVFMYLWAVVYQDQLQHGLTIFWSMLSFVGILFVGYLYALKKHAFDWNR
jgi:NADH-quinone oxidoreductase subunit A